MNNFKLPENDDQVFAASLSNSTIVQQRSKIVFALIQGSSSSSTIVLVLTTISSGCLSSNIIKHHRDCILLVKMFAVINFRQPIYSYFVYDCVCVATLTYIPAKILKHENNFSDNGTQANINLLQLHSNCANAHAFFS